MNARYIGRHMNATWIPVRPAGVAAGPTHTDPVILLRGVSDDRVVGLPLGAAEAGSIVLALEGAVSNEPQTHDLFVTLFDLHGLQPRNVMIYSSDGLQRRARLSYSDRHGNYSLRLRPSDAVALAVRMDVPIYLHVSLFTSEHGATPERVEDDGYAYLPLDGAQTTRGN